MKKKTLIIKFPEIIQTWRLSGYCTHPVLIVWFIEVALCSVISIKK